MYVTWQTIITAGAVFTAVLAIGAVLLKVVRWVDRQRQQDEELKKLQNSQKAEMKEVKAELCLLTYSILACLQGLKELGCNGPVTDAVNKLEKHINQKAHDQNE